jgi:hypothetical protein
LVSASKDNTTSDAALLCEARDPPVYTAPRPDGWIVVSGCTTHKTAVEEDFMWTKPITPPIMVKGLMKEAVAKRNVHIQVDYTSRPKRIMLRGVLYVLGLAEAGGGIKRLSSQRAMSVMMDGPEGGCHLLSQSVSDILPRI